MKLKDLCVLNFKKISLIKIFSNTINDIIWNSSVYCFSVVILQSTTYLVHVLNIKIHLQNPEKIET